MGSKTNIEWTESTWNPLRGCSRVSEVIRTTIMLFSHGSLHHHRHCYGVDGRKGAHLSLLFLNVTSPKETLKALRPQRANKFITKAYRLRII